MKPDDRRHNARRKGESKFIGSRCKQGHIGVRYVSTGGCVDCAWLKRLAQRRRGAQ